MYILKVQFIHSYSLSYYAYKVHYDKQFCNFLEKMIDEKICYVRMTITFMINDKEAMDSWIFLH